MQDRGTKESPAGTTQDNMVCCGARAEKSLELNEQPRGPRSDRVATRAEAEECNGRATVQGLTMAWRRKEQLLSLCPVCQTQTSGLEESCNRKAV